MISPVQFKNYRTFNNTTTKDQRPKTKDVTFKGKEIETVKLITGKQEAKSLVTVVMMSLKNLQQEGLPGMISIFELAQKCKDSSHKLFGNTEEKLKRLNLVQQDGQVHSSIENIVNAASKGEGLNFKLVNPITGK